MVQFLKALLTHFCFGLFNRELYSNNISGIVPYELGNLTNLVSLDLYLNKLSGPIPDTLGKLQRLRFLYEYISPFFSVDIVVLNSSLFYLFVINPCVDVMK